MKPVKNLPIYVLSGALVFVGVASTTQAQAAWTSKETSRVKNLESRIQQLERQLASQELITVRYLATEPSTGLMKDVCPGIGVLESGDTSGIGRLAPKTDILGRPATDFRGDAITEPVYACKIQFYAKKNN